MYLKKPVFWDKQNLTLWAYLLLPITLLYYLIFNIKKILTVKKIFQTKIICVGNIYLGGTGKTPLSDKIARLLEKYYKVAIIKKNYKEQKDEILFLQKNNKVFLGQSRYKAITEAVKKKYNCVILDDGLQDFSIKKNISIACFTSQQGVGNAQIIPSGPLRDSLFSLKKIDIAMINGDKNKRLEKILQKYNKNISIFYTRYIINEPKKFHNKKYLAFSGIGNNINFLNLLKKNNIKYYDHKFFPDHYPYSTKDIASLNNIAKDKKLNLITTEKDFLRINHSQRKNINFVQVTLSIDKENLFLRKLLNENN
jgi:tetraacyldisaccharide 4'-kinase